MTQKTQDVTTFDEGTLHKVYDALSRAEVTGQQAIDAVNQMMNAGILFREKLTFPDKQDRLGPDIFWD